MLKIQFLWAFLLFTASLFAQQREYTPAEKLAIEGMHLHDEGHYTEAVEKFEEALKLDSKSGFIMYELGNTYWHMGEKKKALSWAEKAIKTKDKSVMCETFILKANILDETGKTEKAIETYEEGITTCPDNPMVHFNLGVTELRIGEHESAVKRFESSAYLKPNHGSSHLYLGVSNAELNRKSRTLLPLYFFLFLEPDTKRSEHARMLVNQILESGMQKTGAQEFSIGINSDEVQPFTTADLLISITDAGNVLDLQQSLDSLGIELPKSFPNKVAALNESMFSLFDELSQEETTEPKEDIWDRVYLPFFIALQKAGHTEAFSYLILDRNDPIVESWTTENLDSMNKMIDWINEFYK